MHRLHEQCVVSSHTVGRCKPNQRTLASLGRHAQYAVDLHPIFPVVTTVSQCQGLTVPSLKKNLKIHAVANPTIKITGSQGELRDRLMETLRVREADAKVLRLLEWYDDSVDAIGESIDEELEG